MKRPLPDELRRDVESFIRLMLDKGDSAAVSHVLKLKKALDVGSPVLDSHVNIVAKNALTPDSRLNFTEDEQYTIGELMIQIEAWREGKPGPPKVFPIRVDLRIGNDEQDAIGRIIAKTGEDRSSIIRRLIREADPGK